MALKKTAPKKKNTSGKKKSPTGKRQPWTFPQDSLEEALKVHEQSRTRMPVIQCGLPMSAEP